MSRRSALPGAAELFRVTSEPVPAEPEPAPPAVAPARAPGGGATQGLDGTGRLDPDAPSDASRRSSGRQRHEEKITVYVSSKELFDLEHARLMLRGEHGVAVDRGRLVREALSAALEEFESKGARSDLVRRLLDP